MRAPEPREPSITVVVGQTGVGKTFLTARTIEEYVGKGRKALIFDANDESAYKGYKSLAFDIENEDDNRAAVGVLQFAQQAVAQARRVRAFTRGGEEMSAAQKSRAVLLILQKFKLGGDRGAGLVVVEDINKYMVTTRSADIVSALTTNRHKRYDLLIHFQSLRAVDARLWQNMTWIRFHKQVDTVVWREDIPNFQLVRLAQLIVNRQYKEGNVRFCCYVNVRENKLLGVTPAQLMAACVEYAAEKSDALSTTLNAQTADGTRIYATRQAALAAWSQELVGEYLN